MYEYIFHEVKRRIKEGTLKEINKNDKFNFTCSDDCMGTCCREIMIFLDPWDVEEMARYAGLTCKQFLDAYCRIAYEEDFPWPKVWLKQVAEGPCAFLDHEGRKCRIYAARPRNCRTYPLGRVVQFHYQENMTSKEEKFFLVDTNQQCYGRIASNNGEVDLQVGELTVEEWLERAGADKYYEMADIYLELIDFAINKLKGVEWLNELTLRMIIPVLYTPDVLKLKLEEKAQLMNDEEFYRWRMNALKKVLADMAAEFGPGSIRRRITPEIIGALGGVTLVDRLNALLP